MSFTLAGKPAGRSLTSSERGYRIIGCWKCPWNVYYDPQEQNYEVRGIPPTEQMEIFPPNNLAGAHPRAVLALMDKIRNAPAVGDSK